MDIEVEEEKCPNGVKPEPTGVHKHKSVADLEKTLQTKLEEANKSFVKQLNSVDKNKKILSSVQSDLIATQTDLIDAMLALMNSQRELLMFQINYRDEVIRSKK